MLTVLRVQAELCVVHLSCSAWLGSEFCLGLLIQFLCCLEAHVMAYSVWLCSLWLCEAALRAPLYSHLGHWQFPAPGVASLVLENGRAKPLSSMLGVCSGVGCQADPHTSQQLFQIQPWLTPTFEWPGFSPKCIETLGPPGSLLNFSREPLSSLHPLHDRTF